MSVAAIAPQADVPRPAERAADLPDPAAALARFAAGLRHDDIPQSVRARATHHMLDAVGIALASTTFDFAQRTLVGIAGLAGAGPVPVIGMPAWLPPRDAATVNGVLCHGLDFDDTHLDGIVHPTGAMLPAALSAAMHAGATGRDLVTAYMVGVETAVRLGAVAKGGFHQVGFHPTGMIGVFGCALAAGTLFGLTERQLANAQGIALSMAAGSLEFLEDGAWTKRLHPGWAAAAGLTAAALAKQGFVGPASPYTGRFGLFRSYLGPLAEACDYTLATRALGETWELPRTAVKPFPVCHFAHGCIDAALSIRAQGVAPDAIARIEALVPADVVKTICEPEANKKRPQNSYDAKFSTHYLVAAALVRGRVGLAELESEALSDPAILALADRVAYRTDPESPFPRAYSGEVIVHLKDGRALHDRQEINRGAPDRPLADGEIVEKYRANAALAVGAARRARIEDAVLGLDDCPDLSAFARAIAG